MSANQLSSRHSLISTQKALMFDTRLHFLLTTEMQMWEWKVAGLSLACPNPRSTHEQPVCNPLNVNSEKGSKGAGSDHIVIFPLCRPESVFITLDSDWLTG